MFDPMPDKLIPDLSPREGLVLLARTLWREGYNDHLAGHITCNLGDGTLLCNPWLVLWNELQPHQVIRIDLEGNVVEGDWPVPLGIPLHLALHVARPDTQWAMHNHPLYGTAFANMKLVPPPMDQELIPRRGRLVLVDEHQDGVDNLTAARSAVSHMGEADLALLSGHGVFVLGTTARAVHQRAVALEKRCHHAWLVLAAGQPLTTPLSDHWIDRMRGSDGDGFHGFWEAMVRQELNADPQLLDALR